MAERRMFAKTIVLSDAFLDMPLSARCLYFTLGMVADDDGFVNAPRSVMRQCGSSDDDMKLLIAKKFVLLFDSGVIVIKHWRINNYLRGDRYTETKYVEEKSSLSVEQNGSYTENSVGIPGGIPSVGVPAPEATAKVSIDKDREDKRRIDKESIGLASKGDETEEEGFFGPPLIVLESFAKKNGIEPEEAQAFKTYWDSRKWMTAAGEQVADWKAMFVYQHEHGIPKGKKYQTAREYNEAMKAAPVPTLEQLEFLRDSI